MEGVLWAAALALIMFGLHWRRLRGAVTWVASQIPRLWHGLTEHRFERLTHSVEAAEALLQLRADPSLRFGRRLGRADDIEGGYSGASDMIRRSIKLQRFCLWELERYSVALDPQLVGFFESDQVAQKHAAYRVPIERAREDAAARVAYLNVNKRMATAHGYVSKQLWIASVSAFFSAVAAWAAIVDAQGQKKAPVAPVAASPSSGPYAAGPIAGCSVAEPTASRLCVAPDS
jgi:hypothetical protein